MRLGLILTGGTIGSKTTNGRCQLSDQALDTLELDPSHQWNIYQPIDILSEEATPESWEAIAKQIWAEQENVDAFIILHGTDTMSFTATALSFYCLGLSQPIVITGSRLSPDVPDSDAPGNFRDAVIACQGLGPGCYISFSGGQGYPSLVHSGTRARKSRGDRPDNDPRSFLSSDPVAVVENGVLQLIRNPDREENALIQGFAPGWQQTEIITIRPTLDWEQVIAAIEPRRGYIIELYPSSTAPLPGLQRLLERIEELGGLALAATHEGRLSRTAYPSTELIRQRALQVSFLPETAQIKLGWALHNHCSGEDLISVMKSSLADERI